MQEVQDDALERGLGVSHPACEGASKEAKSKGSTHTQTNTNTRTHTHAEREREREREAREKKKRKEDSRAPKRSQEQSTLLSWTHPAVDPVREPRPHATRTP